MFSIEFIRVWFYRVFCCLCLSLACALQFIAADLFAENQADKDPAAALRELRAKIELDENRLNDLKKHQRKLVIQLERINSESLAAEKKSSELSKALKILDKEQADLTVAVRKAEVESSALRDGFKTRIIAIYKMHRRTSLLDYLFRAESTTDLLKRAYFSSVIASHDRNYIERLARSIRRLNKNRNRLVQLKKEKKEGLEQLDALQEMLSEKRTLKASLLREEREKARLKEKSIKKMRDSANKLERMIARLTGGGNKDAPPLVKKQDQPRKKSDRILHAKGLRKRKGQLKFPVVGSVIQRFGKQKHEEFADMLFIKGLEISSPEGTLVRCIADAEIIFAGALPGYGQVLILDHGKRYYSLYGRISESSRKLGEVVAEGDVVAVLGKPDEKGRNFYFELRYRGKAIDPTAYFSSLPKTLPASDAKS